MKTFLSSLALFIVAVCLSGCESTGVSSRIREKSALFATLTPTQQQDIKAGLIAVGFNSDMVYMALGQPSEVKTRETAQGPVTLWTYKKYFPSDAFKQFIASSDKKNVLGSRTWVDSGSMTPSQGSGESSGARAAAGIITPGASGGGGQPSYPSGSPTYYTLYVVLQKERVVDIAISR